MDGAADSDHSMTWEDFFGSTTDLTPTLIGIYDSLLEPSESTQVSKPQSNEPQASTKLTYKAESSRLHGGPKANKRQPDIEEGLDSKDVRTDTPGLGTAEPKIPGGVKIPGLASVRKSSLYSRRTKVTESESVLNGVSVSVSNSSFLHSVEKMKDQRRVETGASGFDTLSPNVKRMISSASDTTTSNFLKHQNKKPFNVRASIRGHKSNIPLVGATSKISQSGVELLDSVEIYDQPTLMKERNQSEERLQESPVKSNPIKPEFRISVEAPTTYDVPTNLQAIYDVPSAKAKTAFESLSLPYIDQSIELSITSNDREFDIKLNSKDNSPEQPKTSTPESSPHKKDQGTNSLNRKDIQSPSKKLQKTGPYPDSIGSTGNLKLCTVPENQNRLHPPTVEVSRPLSMSSIASSSSTSSSGVQNKGVNSAYLASIESLDDHSDADMVSANGSNNFVNSTGMLTAGNSESLHSQMNRGLETGERSGLSQVQLVCAEIVETENVYVEDLRQVVEGYLHVWRESKTFSAEELAELFNNIEDIYAFNRSLCEQLNTCQLDPTSLARQFVDNTTGFAVYTSYCTGYPQTMSRLAALASCPVGTRACRERQAALQHALPLGSYLLKPVQRILKYHLLLQNLVKQCPSRQTEYALLKMTGIAQHINDMKRRHEHAVRVQEIQSLLYGWSGPDLTTYGELCAEGTFRVFGAKAMRHAFLFDKMLLLTKNREDGILAYKSHIMCNNLMLVESIAGAPLSFHVIPWDAPRAQLTLQARSQRHKREWTLLLKRVILENYNAVIPSHARQLVMELGQNKTDDDMLAEKSHNLITHSSMRKQLSAPEYLEKRKLERERRKTCENRMKKPSSKATAETQELCDCVQVSAEKGIDYTCENCYVDLCSDCEAELSKDKNECSCKGDANSDKCPECDRSLQYIDAGGSVEHLERKQTCCKCSDFNSSQESFGKEYSTLNNTRGYHSSDNIVSYTDKKEELSDVKIIQKTCLKCAKIKENIAITETRTGTMNRRKSRCNELEKLRSDTLRSKSKDDPQRSKLSKISTWRRKSEPGLENATIANILTKRVHENERSIDVPKGHEKIEFECRNCGSNKVTRNKSKNEKAAGTDSDQGLSKKIGTDVKPNIEVRMYNTKHVPKKISKIRKSKGKGMRFGADVTAKFYADFSTDVSTENILHISESTDSINTITKEEKIPNNDMAKQDPDMDEETYKKLLEKTDSFKKNELEKVKYLNQQKVINESAECESDKQSEPEKRHLDEESGEESEKPLEQIISQLLMQNREFQKILKKQQLRNGAQRRHQRLLKSHSNPEQVPLTKNKEHKIRPKYGRQTSENLKLNTNETEELSRLSPQKELDNDSDDEHIYETLRVEPKIEIDEIKNPPKARSPSPPKNLEKLNTGVNSRLNAMDSDYVYLSFDKVKPTPVEDDSIYDVPSSIPVRVQKLAQTDYYVAINKNDNIYDQVDACKRDIDNANISSGDYLPMSKDQPNPKNPEIWLSRQKEHFTVSRDRKSGSLPRSFQVVTGVQDETSLSTFKSKPNGSNKTYLNRDGRVLSTDRPFTIASDKSEISYDDVETYMNDDDVLKYNKPSSNQNFYDGELENLSKSTLELEEEIDRCYKNNFEKNLGADSNRNLLTDSQQNIDISVNSSCEVLSPEKQPPDNVNLVHPEHKIYKPTTNMLSIKNVLSRFKTKTPNKNSFDNETEVNANEQSTSDTKTDVKSPTSNEKRSALNPRSYSKNLLQRFKSIIGDEHADDPKNEPRRTSLEEEMNQNKFETIGIKVVITSTDTSPTTSVIVSSNADMLSKSVCEQTTLTESQNEKNILDTLSRSCDNIKQPDSQCFRPIYDKSISMITSTPSSVNSSPSRSSYGSYQNFNKLPIYKQGSKHLGARIAQSDYVDPQTLLSCDSKTDFSNVNVLINKNAVRPDSLLSNSSFVTSSSEGTYQVEQNKSSVEKVEDKKESTEGRITNKSLSGSSVTIQSDESFYEKSFEKIENMVDQDLFRDSAVYSDQEDSDDMKLEVSKSLRMPVRNMSRLETIKRNSSIKSEYKSAKKIETKSNVQTVSTVTTLRNINKSAVDRISEPEKQTKDTAKQKIAPPVPVKPKIGTTHNKSSLYSKSLSKPLSTVQKESAVSMESLNSKTVKRNSGVVKSVVRTDSVISSESVSIESKLESSKSESANYEPLSRSESIRSSKVTVHVASVEENSNTSKSESSSSSKLLQDSSGFLSRTASHSIQMKRLSFERTSLDSATRKAKVSYEAKKSELPKSVSKSVLERRMEIESMSKGSYQRQSAKPKQIVPPKSITSKMASYERSISEESKQSERASPRKELRSTSSVEKSNIPKPGPSVLKESRSMDETETDENLDARESWVKTIVNKFQ